MAESHAEDVAHDILGVRRNSPRWQNPMLKDVAHDILGFGRNSPRCQNPMLKDVAHDILGVRRNSPRCQNPMLKDDLGLARRCAARRSPLLFAWWRCSGVEVVGSHHVDMWKPTRTAARGSRSSWRFRGGHSGSLIGLRERVPWPLAGLPFPFDDIMMMYGEYLGVAPSPGYAPPAPAVALQPCGKRVDPNDVCTGKDAIPPLDALLSWLTLPVRVPDVDEDQYAVPTFA